MTVLEDPKPVPSAFGVECGARDGRLVVALVGELDSQAAPELRRCIDELDIDGDLVIDLTRLTFVDSMGLGCLFRLHQRVADAGGIVEAHGATPAVRNAIHLVQLHRVIAVVD